MKALSLKKGDVISFWHKRKWFIQHVDNVHECVKNPSVSGIKIGYYPYHFLLEDEGKTWVKGVHPSLLEQST